MGRFTSDDTSIACEYVADVLADGSGALVARRDLSATGRLRRVGINRAGGLPGAC